jgi:hypothetical protein
MRSNVSASEMLEKVKTLASRQKSFTPNEIVILCHDPMLENEYSRQQLLEFIRLVKDKPGWRFSHLSHYPVKGEMIVENF